MGFGIRVHIRPRAHDFFLSDALAPLINMHSSGSRPAAGEASTQIFNETLLQRSESTFLLALDLIYG